MAFGLSKARALDGLTLLLLAGVVAYGAGTWLEARSFQRTQEAMSAASPPIGRRVDALLVSDEDGSVQRLSDGGGRKCRYVIIGSRICPHTVTAANQWTITALSYPARQYHARDVD